MGCINNKGKEALASMILAVFNAEQNVDEEKFHAVDNTLKKYDITSEHIKKGRRLTIEEAISILSNLDTACQKEIHEVLYRIASSDKYCAPEEALLLTALDYHLQENGRIFSIKSDDLKLSGKTAYFVIPSNEVYKDQIFLHECTDHIRRHLDEVIMCFYCFGYDFVFIPQLVKDYSTNPSIVKCLHDFASNFSDASIDSINKAIEDFSSFGTAEFTNMLFKNRIKDNLDDHDQPGLMIKINDSYVNRKKYYNFIYIPFLSNGISAIINTAKNFFLKYQEKVSLTSYLVTPELPNRLRHFDLYMTILDYRIRNGEKIQSSLTIDLNKMCIIFNELDISVKMDMLIVDYLYLAWKSQPTFIDHVLQCGKDPEGCHCIKPLKELRTKLFGQDNPYLGDDDYIVKNYRKTRVKIKDKIENISNLANPNYYYPEIYHEKNSPFKIGYEIRFYNITVIDIDHNKYNIDESPTCREMYDYL